MEHYCRLLAGAPRPSSGGQDLFVSIPVLQGSGISATAAASEKLVNCRRVSRPDPTLRSSV